MELIGVTAGELFPGPLPVGRPLGVEVVVGMSEGVQRRDGEQERVIQGWLSSTAVAMGPAGMDPAGPAVQRF
jgi:hypothetical protein